jgi:uncharacterized protein YcbK (DUF882 family)
MRNRYSPDLTRRQLLGFFGATAALLATPLASAKVLKAQGARSLSLYNLHTGEKLKTDFWIDGEYQPEALAAIDKILRDHRCDETCNMDRDLVDLIHRLSRKLHTRRPLEIISGYRSPETNEALREMSSGVAQNSYHTKGMAVDIRLADRSLSDLYRGARALERGGVGYYARSRFVHVDVGPVRTWGRKA